MYNPFRRKPKRDILPDGDFLTQREAHVLADLLDITLQGLLETKKLATEDPNINTPEDLLDLTAEVDFQIKAVTRLRTVLRSV